MDKELIPYEQIYAFAKDIIVRTPNFREFAEAVMDFAGGATDDVFKAYEELRGIKFPTGVKIDDPEEIARYTIDDLSAWYDLYQLRRKRKFEEEKQKVKENIDELQYLIEEYRNSDRFLKMLKDIVPVKKALWYANDKQMKDAVDKEINNKQDVLPIISLF